MASPPPPPSSGQQQQQPPGDREIMYCHECENEWYRDERGLTCPDCGSDFAEVVEAGSDPRDPGDPDEEAPDMYMQPGMGGRQEGMQGLMGHNPWAGEGTAQGQGQGQQQPQGLRQGQGQNLGMMGMFGPMLQGLLGAGQQQAQQRAQQPQGVQRWNEYAEAEDTDERNRSVSNEDGTGGNTTHRHFSGPGYSVSFTSTTSGGHMVGGARMGSGIMGPGGGMNPHGLHPRDANNPQPMQGQPDDLQNILNQMFMNIGAGPTGMGGPHQHAHNHHHHHHPPFMMGGPGAPGGHGGPFGGLFQQLFGAGMPGAGGQMGDAVFTQEALDRVVSQLMEQHQSGNAPGPASETAIRNLPRRTIVESDIDPATGSADCSICMENVVLGDEVTVLPCEHWFHGECIKAWLVEHDTCPQCRRGIMPKEGEGDQRPRGRDEAPRYDMSSPQAGQQMPGGFPAGSQGGHSQGEPTNGSGGEMFGRMRQAFGNGGGTGGGDAGPSGDTTRRSSGFQ